MLILWIRKSKVREQTCQNKNDEDTFQKHAEDMIRFRLAHPNIEATSSNDIITADGNILAPVQNVKLSKCSQN